MRGFDRLGFVVFVVRDFAMLYWHERRSEMSKVEVVSS